MATRQLARKDFAQNLLTRLAKHNIPERFFALEVTESGCSAICTTRASS